MSALLKYLFVRPRGIKKLLEGGGLDKGFAADAGTLYPFLQASVQCASIPAQQDHDLYIGTAKGHYTLPLG